ncbi:DUF58 domain-containing protein [Thermococcus sp. M36]|uniref:DUF58 domain-containing protein n=1 Tax=Thermococcus sp. M36 TaxID=1638261 RepID=UPI00143A8E3B|nr:DUF58 domain-containing protein [Thermococcus sp. M36]NJE05378.1 DUF58 domain-containing protein [Thermococcus sp. M36]
MRRVLFGYLLWALLTGVLFLSPGMVGVAVIPLSLLAAGMLMDPPGAISLRRTVSRTEVRTGEEVEVSVRLRVERGVGIVVVRDRLPGNVAVTRGSNVGVFFKGFRPLEVSYSYTVRPVLRGTYVLPKSEVTTRNPLGVRYFWGLYGDEIELRAIPAVVRGIPLRGVRRRAKINVPETSFSIRGPLSTDFREIRAYQTGDPMKLINWKATARTGRVLVNEFEREGKKTVVFIVDARDSMKVGVEGESPYEHAMNLVASMARGFLRRDYHVGLYILGAKKFIPPSTGPRQLHKIVKAMVDFERVKTGEERLKEAVERMRRTLVQYTPLVVYVSNILEGQREDTKQGLLSLMAVSRGSVKPVVVDVSVYSALDPHTGTLLEMEKRFISGELGETGAYVVRWVVEKEDVGSMLSRLMGEIK